MDLTEWNWPLIAIAVMNFVTLGVLCCAQWRQMKAAEKQNLHTELRCKILNMVYEHIESNPSKVPDSPLSFMGIDIPRKTHISIETIKKELMKEYGEKLTELEIDAELYAMIESKIISRETSR